jgi:signal transduction histidine kinase
MARGKLGHYGPALLVVAITALSTVAASVFSDRLQAQRIATDGTVFTAAERVASVASGIRTNLGLTIVLASGEQAGVEVIDDVDDAIGVVRANLVTLESEAARLDALLEVTDHTDSALAAVGATDEVLAALTAADSSQATGLANELALRTAIPALLATEQAAAAAGVAAEARIDAERAEAGDAAFASSLLVALVVPALAVTTLWMSSRRRVERLSLRAEIDKNIALLRARDDLIAGISHQLRTPLTGIVGYTDSLIASPDDVPLRTEGLATIQAQAGELTRMIDDLLVMARLEDGQVEIHQRPLDPISEIEMVAKTQMVEVRTSLVPAVVIGDRLRLRHILTNLVSNAVRHGGPTVAIKAGPSEGRYRIVVADDGSGVPAELLDNVFRPYVHSARDSLVTGSLGLGLAVAKQLADQMGCHLTHQRLNGYTLFVLDMPLAQSGTTQIAASAGSRRGQPEMPSAASWRDR